jgi:hypothetical protein
MDKKREQRRVGLMTCVDRGSACLCRHTSAGHRPMSGRFCRFGVSRPCFPGSARVGTCLAGYVDGVPERSDNLWHILRYTGTKSDLHLMQTQAPAPCFMAARCLPDSLWAVWLPCSRHQLQAGYRIWDCHSLLLTSYTCNLGAKKVICPLVRQRTSASNQCQD